MSVYVDPLHHHYDSSNPEVPRCFRQSGGACHLYADSLDELHKFALKLGMKRSWFQEHDLCPHYDLVPAKRTKAIQLGAIEHDNEKAVAKWREIRSA